MSKSVENKQEGKKDMAVWKETSSGELAFRNYGEFKVEFEKYSKQAKAQALLNNALGGNRASINNRFEIFSEYINLGKRGKNHFLRIALLKGHSVDKAEELWNIFNVVMIEDFKAFVLGQHSDKINEDEEFVI